MADKATIGRLLGSDWQDTHLTLQSDQPAGPVGLRRLLFRSSWHEDVPALYLPPKTGACLLYCHAHGARYHIGMAELTDGRPALQAPYLPEFIQRGWGVLCLEMPCFGARSDMNENAVSKARLWHGRTLFGQMLAEQRAGLDWLLGQPEVNANRTAVMGISMGGTLAWWLSALDTRLRASVSMCCFADLGTLIETGAHDGHGNYMTVPGLLKSVTTGRLAGLAAPRPAMHCVGLSDWSTPEPAFRKAQSELTTAYREMGAKDALTFHVAENVGHEETAEMRKAVLTFLVDHLAP